MPYNWYAPTGGKRWGLSYVSFLLLGFGLSAR